MTVMPYNDPNERVVVRSPETTDYELRQYDKYASRVKGMLLLAGLWPDPGHSRLYRLVSVFYVMSCVYTSSGMMSFVFDNVRNLSLLSKGLGVMVSFYTAILKVLIFSLYRDDLVELHEILAIGFQKDFARAELRPVLLSPLRFFYRPTMWLSISTWMLVLIYSVTPIISIIIQQVHNAKRLKYHTPYPTKYPWSLEENLLVFIVQYVSEMCTGFGVGAITTGTDALFGFYIFQMTSQFRTLSYRMANLASSEDYNIVIKECVQRRQMLAHCRDKLQTLYGPIVLWMLMTSAMTICANIFQASQISIDKATLVVVYIIMKLIQTLLYGWYGLFLTTESEAFQESVYSSGWHDSSDKAFLSNILIMLMYKPFVLKACQFSAISLDMFLAIMNTAVSYFFLLQTIDEK